MEPRSLADLAAESERRQAEIQDLLANATPLPDPPAARPPRNERGALKRRARLIAFEALYEWDAAGHPAVESLVRRLESAGVAVDGDYARDLVAGVERQLPRIDALIGGAATAYPIEQMAKVDKAILRLAIHEIVFDNRVPLRAAINEAVELAKLYGGERSPQFVNGVLGAVAGQSATAQNS